ncbi:MULTISPECIES: HepT-like ribonuclease domain-containing protein [unclassified Rhizobium]|uniref:HepT-like ribonuclease domain-containing protein n=1 Tax=unclassified Rhizobium TaxID=2613769 RepID=UPI001ADD1A84|nr:MULTISPECIES: DUF86 domain-containing protein [unclassified Rhizobium]MBO9099142.1 DUF86 domain-containing protein [Rhizobium sp. L58/93]MBO9169404.1 DUF86 domain-containing protein [Rhizobium sp. L245/93]MBO9185355.1 DUF86 domain-containing protein [Rhizobium sp. E27B/91]QXZ85494.1 DUF86 domain-containing protein [Rhizobium sp. K1/93]QXZ90366.1 DUF86 domain-containing protein [Rhizobium sp. K15/93]
MSGDRLATYLDRMQSAATKASKYASDVGHDAFLLDERTQDAVVMNIMAISECVVKIMNGHPDFVAQHSDIPWRDIRDMRNRIAHQYFQVDLDTVWYTAATMLPELLDQLQGLRNWRAQGE